MSCFSHCESSRGVFSPETTNGRAQCVAPDMEVTERIMDVLKEVLGPDKQIFSVTIPAAGRAIVPFRQQSERSPQTDESAPAVPGTEKEEVNEAIEADPVVVTGERFREWVVVPVD
ncbi:MAG: hypothetical protein OXF02_01160 [Simkaniaceae bacterium]|nr:hypothetical protein [Simkaniaceae bacterium]